MDIENERPRMYRNQFYVLLICSLLLSNVSWVFASTSEELTFSGVSALKAKNYGTATTYFYQALSQATAGSKDYNRAQYYLIRSFVELDNPSSAQTYITQLLNGNPTGGYLDGALYYQMRIALQQKNFSLLSTSFVQLTSEYPQAVVMPAAYFRYAEGFRKINHDDLSAIQYARKILTQYPDNVIVPAALVTLGATYYDYYKQTKDTTQLLQCEQVLNQCLSQYPNTFNAVEAHYWKGYLQQNAYSNITGAIQEYQTLVNLWSTSSTSLQPVWQTGFAVDSLCMEAQWQIARGYSSLNDAPNTLKAYQQFIENYPNSPKVPLAQKSIADLQNNTPVGIKP